MRVAERYIKEVENQIRESEAEWAYHKERVLTLRKRRKEMLERVKAARSNLTIREITRQLRPSFIVPHQFGVYVQLPNVTGNKIASVKRFLTNKGLEVHSVLTNPDNKFQYEYVDQDGTHYFINYREAK